MSQQAPNSEFSADKETRRYVTPFAFGVADSLLGVKLATPRRRLWAILVDIFCVGVLTQLNATWLSIIVLLVVMNAYSHIKNEPGKAWAKSSLFAAMSMAILILLVKAATYVWSDNNVDGPAQSNVEQASAIKDKGTPDNNELTYRSSDYNLILSSLSNKNGAICTGDDKCGEDFFRGLSKDMFEKGVSYVDAAKAYNEIKALLGENNKLDDASKSWGFGDLLYQNVNVKDASEEAKSSGRLLAWFQDLLSDLGLSFGWSAVYFSVLTAWWNGQTLGKRLFGIRVVRIDGKPIDLWESVGRYGGYSAGLATGLLGFVQIYWDANRQTIQDKISETLVIQT